MNPTDTLKNNRILIVDDNPSIHEDIRKILGGDGGHIFRDLVQSGFERILRPQEAERYTRTTVTILSWLVLTSLLITLIAPFTNWLPI